MPFTFDIPNVGNIFFDNTSDSNTVDIPTTTALTIFREKAIKAPSIAQNFLMLYSLVNVGRNGEARYGSFTTPRWGLRKRQGCVWNPSTCSLDFNGGVINTCPIVNQKEICPDFLWDSCWEKLLAVGNGKNDLNSTTEAQRLLAQVVDKVMLGQGNDIYSLLAYANHPIIDQANDGKWYLKCGISEEKWKCFYEMMKACNYGGYLTIFDELKYKEGLKNYNVTISASEVEGDKFVGSATDLFARLKEAQTNEFAIWGKSQSAPLIFGVTKSIFNKYKKEIIEKFSCIPESYQLMTQSEIATNMMAMRGILWYDGDYVVCMDEWDELSAMTCTYSHRAALMAPGVIGLAYDVPFTNQFNGMGMQITQRLRAPFQGKIYFDNTFRTGAAVLDKDFVAYAEYTEER